jgi:hypothetical protein
MKLVLRISIIAGILTFAAAAWAQTGTMLVNIDRDFIAAGKLLPAGKYKVFPSSTGTLVLRSEETRNSVFLVTGVRNPPVFADESGVKLTLSGEMYYLSEVKTDLGAYSLVIPRTMTHTAKTMDHTGIIASGSN